jgi:hypothetical protein
VKESADKAINPYRIAVLYYFGDLPYWKLPQIAADALEQGYDGDALRRIAGLDKPVASDIRPEEIDCAFRELGVAAPLAKDKVRLILAAESAARALQGSSNVFDEATHIRIHLCESKNPPPELNSIVSLSEKARRTPPRAWNELEAELRDAMADFLHGRH